MSGLMSYVEESRQVPFSKKEGQYFVVHQISIEDLIHLIDEFRGDIEQIFESKDKSVNPYTLLSTYPELCYRIIAKSAREPEDDDVILAKVRTLPAGVVIMALVKIWDMMHVDIKEVGNVIRELMGTLNELNQELAQLPESNGSKNGKALLGSASETL